MLQRSPTYVISRPDKDVIANALRAVLPDRWAYAITRWKNVAMQQFFYGRSRTRPGRSSEAPRPGTQGARAGLRCRDALHAQVQSNGTKRLCLVPNGDLFVAIRSGKASIVTDRIEHFTEHGVKLKSGRELDADIIVTATGLTSSSWVRCICRRRHAGRFRADLDLQGDDVFRRGRIWCVRSATSMPRGRCVRI